MVDILPLNHIQYKKCVKPSLVSIGKADQEDDTKSLNALHLRKYFTPLEIGTLIVIMKKISIELEFTIIFTSCRRARSLMKENLNLLQPRMIAL